MEVVDPNLETAAAIERGLASVDRDENGYLVYRSAA
jgi:hypothetical protein